MVEEGVLLSITDTQGFMPRFPFPFPCFICTDVFAKPCHQLGEEGAFEKKIKMTEQVEEIANSKSGVHYANPISC